MHSRRAAVALRLRRFATRAAPPKTELGGVQHIVAVASGKGGVGKSSVCVNLAFAVQQLGFRVGVLDADLYGPSLPAMVPSAVGAVGPRGTKDGKLFPFFYRDAPLMSMGFLRPGDFSAIRGPMVSAMLQQMLTATLWGELDFLFVDLPPGTGDIHLTVSQQAQVGAAVVVTTPQHLSLLDVDKGIRMFDAVSIPTACIVENMSYFQCDCGKKHDIFKRGAGASLAQRFGVERYFRLPLDPALGELGEPFVLNGAVRNSGLAEEFTNLARETVAAVRELKTGRAAPSVVSENSGSSVVMTLPDRVCRTPARALRLRCQSARMIDEFTGAKLFREQDIAMDVTVTKIVTAGRYAVSIEWSDGHSSLFSYSLLEQVCGEQ